MYPHQQLRSSGSPNNHPSTICQTTMIQLSSIIIATLIMMFRISKNSRHHLHQHQPQQQQHHHHHHRRPAAKCNIIVQQQNATSLSLSSSSSRMHHHRSVISAHHHPNPIGHYTIILRILPVVPHKAVAGSFKKRKTIGEIGCCESRMSKQKH